MARLRSLSRRQRKEAGAPVHSTNPHSAQGQWDIFFSTVLEGETDRSVNAKTRAENLWKMSPTPGPIQLSLAVVNREETSAISAATVQPCPS
jgi:hypothetical protein